MIITWKEILSQTADGPTWRRTPSCCRTPSSYGRTWRRPRPRCPRRCPPPTCCTAPICRCPGSGSWTRGSCVEDVHGDLRCQSPASPDIPAIKIKILKHHILRGVNLPVTLPCSVVIWFQQRDNMLPYHQLTPSYHPDHHRW